jgi:molecular chaperone GrpE
VVDERAQEFTRRRTRSEILKHAKPFVSSMSEDADTVQQDADEPEPVADDADSVSSLVAEIAHYDEDLAADVGELEDEATALRAEVEEQAATIDELTERVKRVQADFKNYKERSKRRLEDEKARATEDLVTRLLDVRDNLDRALEGETTDVDALREGVELTRKEFDHVLDQEGVEEIRPDAGAEVDAARHEVMMRVPSDDPEGTVAEVYRPGYEMGGKVLRPAQVTVSDGADGTAEDAAD